MNFNLARELAEKEAASFVGEPKAKCPSNKTCLIVLVYKEDTGEVIPGVKVQMSGTSQAKKGQTTQSFLAKNTDKNGLAKFTPWDPGSYTADLSLPQQDGYEKPDPMQSSVSRGTCPVWSIPVKRLPRLQVKVVEKGNHSRVFENAVVKVVSAPQQHGDKNTAKSGVADFGRTKSGKYVVQVTALKEADRKDFAVPKLKVEETLNSGDDKTVIIEVEKINVVSPKIELEYKVVLFDRGLARYQAPEEKRIFVDPTYIKLSFTQTGFGHQFGKGGKLKCSPSYVEVYLDEKCEKKVAGNPASGLTIESMQLQDLNGVKLFLKGTARGIFKVSFELDNPNDDLIRLEKNPAEEEMGVVELIMRVHQHEESKLKPIKIDPDTDPIATYHTNLLNKVLPDQTEMNDVQKTKRGRVLHAQKESNFDLAKIVVDIDTNEWPAETAEYKVNDYYVVINETNTSGAVESFDKEWDGTLQLMPLKIKVQDLKASKGKKEFWVQGKDVTKKLREVRLDLGVDRETTGHCGLDKTEKRNGDWARFTVVQIAEIKIEYTKEPGKAVAWDKDNKRFYINLKPDNATHDGRKINISARLSEKLEGVTIHLALTPDRNNLKKANWGIDFPSSWKWKDIPAELKHKDKNDRKDLLHLSGETDKDGYVKLESFWLSRFGGDKFHLTAYIDQDPHLAKYVHAHAQLGLKKPVFSKESPIQVWRKVWYQVTRPRDTPMPGDGGFAASQRKVFLEAIVTEEKEMTAANFTLNPFRPDWQFNPGGSDDLKLCIGDHNVNDAMALFTQPTDDTKPKFHAILCDEQFDAEGVKTNIAQILWDADMNPQDVETEITGKEERKVTIIDPPLQGRDLIVSAEWVALESPDGVNITLNHRGNLSAGNISILKTRGSKRTVRVTPPAQCPGGANGCPCGGPPTNLVAGGTNAIALQLELQAADGPYNGWAPSNSVANVVKGGRDDFQIHNTMAHELGHLFGQVRWQKIDGLPDHPKMYQKRGGYGEHCAIGATWAPDATVLDPTTAGELDAQGMGGGRWQTGTCILFGSTTSPIMKREWCEHCAFELIVSDLSKFS